ncbi:MAG: hypothetical protein ACLQNE_02660 [Thermoguttaceae bacterium]
MRCVGLWFAMLLAASAIGCSGTGTSKGPESPSPAAAKAALADVAATGKMGSGMMPVRPYLDSLKKTDPAKAEELSKEVHDLGKLSKNPAALKAKAKEIADKL